MIPFKEKKQMSTARSVRQGGRAAGGDDGFDSDGSEGDLSD